jgi:hypothetical protein
MRVQLSNVLAAMTLLAGWGCGSASDLIIGHQAEASAPLRPTCPGNAASDVGICDASVEASEEPAEVVDAQAETEVDAPSDGAPCPFSSGPCTSLKSALIHRYSFNGAGTMVTDSVGTAHGTVIGTRLNGDGSLILAGDPSDQFVDLPNGIIRSLHDATFEAWVSWNGGAGWQRIFDFGSSEAPEGTRGVGAVTTLYLTPQSGVVVAPAETNVMVGAFKRADQDPAIETRAVSMQPMSTGVTSHVVLVVDDTNDLITLYRDGAPVGSKAFLDALSLLNDINNWLGRSQYSIDPAFNGRLYEFRIFNRALTDAGVRTLFLGGTDPAFLN